MTHSPCNSEIIHVHVCLYARAEGAWWTFSSPGALCPLYIIHHTDRPFHSWIQNSGWETTSNTLSCPPSVRTSLPARWTPRLNFCPVAMEPNLSNGENYEKLFFYFLPFFHLKIRKFSSRGGFSAAALVAWPLVTGKEEGSDLNGRHLKFLEVSFPPTAFPFSVERKKKKKVKSKVRSVLVHFVRRSGDTLEFTLGNTDRDVSLCLWWI